MATLEHLPADGGELRVQWSKTVPFAILHLGCLGVFWVGWSRSALVFCLLNYLLRMFAITAGYHRYFSHRSFKTSRPFQFALAWIGATAAQLGPLWWAAHHRDHHRHSDTEKDAHPPGLRGFLWSHMGWVFCPRYALTHYERVKDLARFPELLFVEKNWLLPPALLALTTFVVGGAQALVWGFIISTVLLYHATFSINSMAHLYGTRRYDTGDDSRNNFWLALLTLGEGWHNNHHKYPTSERQGIYWWELDMTHYGLTVLSWMGLVWDLRGPALPGKRRLSLPMGGEDDTQRT